MDSTMLRTYSLEQNCWDFDVSWTTSMNNSEDIWKEPVHKVPFFFNMNQTKMMWAQQTGNETKHINFLLVTSTHLLEWKGNALLSPVNEGIWKTATEQIINSTTTEVNFEKALQ